MGGKCISHKVSVHSSAVVKRGGIYAGRLVIEPRRDLITNSPTLEPLMACIASSPTT